MALDIDALNAWDFEEIEHTYVARDTILYALGLGFGEDPTDEAELAYVYEDGLKAAIAVAKALGTTAPWANDVPLADGRAVPLTAGDRIVEAAD